MEFFISPTDGTKHPVVEAKQPIAVIATREDYETGIIGDEARCGQALSLLRRPGVKEAYVGSGEDTYIVMKEDRQGNPGPAVHYINSTTSGKMRDLFDQHEEMETHLFWLLAPSKTMTREYRSKVNKNYKEVLKTKRPTVKTRKSSAPDFKSNEEEARKERVADTTSLKRSSGSLPKPRELPKKKRRTRFERLGVPRRHRAPIIKEEDSDDC